MLKSPMFKGNNLQLNNEYQQTASQQGSRCVIPEDEAGTCHEGAFVKAKN